MEELEDLKDYEGLYKINRAGQVFGVKRQKFVRQSNAKKGYYDLVLNKEGKSFYTSIHRLLALQFLPNPLGLPEVDHIDLNRSNNSLDNLRWVSRRTNCCNKNIKPKSGEHHILVTCRNTYEVRIRLGDKGLKRHSKCFKTMEEAIAYRDTFLRKNNLV